MPAEKTKNLLKRIEACSSRLFPGIRLGDSFYAVFADEKQGVLAFSSQGCERISFYNYKQKKNLFSGMIDGVIRWVSFHPDKEIAAVSTLGYGGYSEVFGQIYLLNYNTGETEPVFGDALSPGVYSAVFKPGNRLWIQFTDVADKGRETEIDLPKIPVNSALLSTCSIESKVIIDEPSLEETAAILEKITQQAEG